MIDIPKNIVTDSVADFEKKVDEACAALVEKIERQKKENFKVIQAQIKTEHCHGGGYPMPVINEVAKRFAKEGWFVYLVQGGAYRDWTWLSVFSTEQHEGYTDANVPSFYKRVRV